MSEFAAKVSCASGCADIVGRLDKERVESFACACAGADEGVASFSVASPDKLSGLDKVQARRADSSIIQVRVANSPGCLSRVTRPLTEAGVALTSLSCACAGSDASCTVAVGMARK